MDIEEGEINTVLDKNIRAEIRKGSWKKADVSADGD